MTGSLLPSSTCRGWGQFLHALVPEQCMHPVLTKSDLDSYHSGTPTLHSKFTSRPAANLTIMISRKFAHSQFCLLQDTCSQLYLSTSFTWLLL